jgi:hypothetical protein
LWFIRADRIKRGRDSKRYLPSSTICDGVYFVWYGPGMQCSVQHCSTHYKPGSETAVEQLSQHAPARSRGGLSAGEYQGWQGRRGARGAGRQKRAPRRKNAGRGAPKTSASVAGRGARGAKRERPEVGGGGALVSAP